MKKNKPSAFILIFAVVVATILISGIAATVIVLSLSGRKAAVTNVNSYQAYYSAESGAEDVLLQAKRTPGLPASSYSLNVGGSVANISVSGIIGGSRTIESQGDSAGRIKKVKVIYSIETDHVSFHYGAQVGDGGLSMGNGSSVLGNVFSNGNATGGGTIANSIIVAGSGHFIDGLNVGEDATVHTCKNSAIGGTLTYVSGGSSQNCEAGEEIITRPNQIDPEPLPISLDQINEWKAQAEAGGTIGSQNISGIQTLGPKKISGNLNFENGATLIITGTIYVTGSITTGNNVNIKLDPSYGYLSGVVLSDGLITISNNTVLRGSGSAGSYVLLASDKNSPSGNGIDLSNNVDGATLAGTGAIFYTNSSLIKVSNNVNAREITGYGLVLNNNAQIKYEVGLENALFSNGQGGSWKVLSWDEVE